ncbi:MAG: NAD(P)H-dependent oxidoreductase subunit E [Candidatus Azosocius agrarius]|nr:MAG: NAD(P)H-dependent oxidoreductase subunit E [Gammaproteobacteria bacterium]
MRFNEFVERDVNKLLLSDDCVNKINLWVEKFPSNKKRSVIIPALRIVQDANEGFLTIELMDAVAKFLDVPNMYVYEVATFYSMYELKRVGKYKLSLCTNISCMLNGSDDIVNYLKSKLDIDFNEITKDGKFSLKEVECLAACGGAPVMQIGTKYYENLTIDKIDKILETLE